MCRPVTSCVSALSGCVANGHQALHHVSSSPSEIPYGGFSPVRLQTASLHRNLRQPGQPGSLYAINGPVGLRLLSARTVSGWRETAPGPAVQRPLARRRVILSRQVMAYYGLIRASRSLPPSYLLVSTAGLCLSARTERVPNLLCVSVLSVPSSVPRRTGRRARLLVLRPC